MKKKMFFLFAIITIVSTVVMTSCDFNNLGKDDDGKDIPLLRLDLPKFDATYMFNFVDYSSGSQLNVPLDVKFTGFIVNGLSDKTQLLITDACNVKESFAVTNGLLSLNLNPNVKLSNTNPIEFTVNVEQKDNYVGIPKVIKQTASGAKMISVDVINLASINNPQSIGAKMVSGRSNGGITVSSSYGDLLPLAKLSGKSNGNGYDYVGIYRANNSANYSVANTNTDISDWGIYLLTDNISAAPTKTKQIEANQLFFVVKKRTNIKEGKINLSFKSSVSASASFMYEIVAGEETYSGVVSGILPFNASIEQIYVPSTSTGATIKLTAVAPYKISTTTLETPDITVKGGANLSAITASIDQNNKLKTFSFNLLGYCPTDKKITFAVTKDFQYSKGDKTSAEDGRIWNIGQFNSGKAIIHMEENQDYTFRVCVDNKWYSYDITTKMNELDGFKASLLKEGCIYNLVKNNDGSYFVTADITIDEFCNF